MTSHPIPASVVNPHIRSILESKGKICAALDQHYPDVACTWPLIVASTVTRYKPRRRRWWRR